MQEIKPISSYKQGLKDKILLDAMRSFAEKGIRAVKMDDIAAHLSISKRTLYEIYANKEDLLFEGVHRYHHEMEQRISQINESGENVMEVMLNVYQLKVEEFNTTNMAFYEDLAKYPAVIDYLQCENKKLHALHMSLLERGVSEGFFRSDINFELASMLFNALGRYVMSEELYRKFSINDIFNNLVFVSLRGFCTEMGVKALDKFQLSY